MAMKRVIAVFVCLFCMSVVSAQNISDSGSIIRFLGASSEEDIDADEVERLETYLSRPLRINDDRLERMVSSGLLTRYQAASLTDYRNKNGDVLSLSELAAVNGFGKEFVELLAPFISLDSHRYPGQIAVGERKINNDLAIKTGHKYQQDDGMLWNWGMKYRMETAGGVDLSAALSKSYDAPGATPELISSSLSWTSKRSSVKLIAGDFNARFGQGLAFWNGMMVNSLSSPASFSRNATGISRSWSYTGSSAVRGIAASVPVGRFMISSVLSLPDLKKSLDLTAVAPVLNVAWYGRNGQFSLTNHMEFSGAGSADVRIPHFKSAADIRWCIRGTDMFSEIAYDWVNNAPAGLAGTDFRLGDNMRMAILARYYPAAFDSHMSGAVRSGSKCSNELSFSVSSSMETGAYVKVNGAEGFGSSVRRLRFTLSADAVAFPESKSDVLDRTWQLATIFGMQTMLKEALRIDVRLKSRYRNWEDDKLRTDVRVDLCYLSRRIVSTVRINALKNVGLAFLSYVEAGYKADAFTLYLRQGFFRIDNWDDRIYAYERDAPGSFSVPAYYGRGLWTALTASWKYARWGRLYVRVSYLGYPFMEKKKPGKAELKLQSVFSF